MNAQSPESPNRDNFGTPLWESREKVPFGCKWGSETQRILYGEGGGFPRVRAVVSQMSPRLPVACSNIKSSE
jgi:hypothetical protein